MIDDLLTRCATPRGRLWLAASLLLSYYLLWLLPPGSFLFYVDAIICGCAFIVGVLTIWRYPWEVK